MERLNTLAEKIISLLIFEESFGNILSEIPEHKTSSIGDELKILIAKDLVKPCKDIENETKSGVMYDSDMMLQYSFMLSAKGLAYLEQWGAKIGS